tara:strand:+ start:2904 stop:3476 length:573 start_codon:yes stop_codon:yes gene_type:complete
MDYNLNKYNLIVKLLLKINPKYVWWTSDMENCGPQSYSDSNDIVDFDIIKENGINCVGLINIIRRCLNLEIPGLNESNYAGGTYEWFKYLKKNKKLKKFNINKIYPNGTLLLRDYKNEFDQGHVAIIYESNKENILESKLLHAYANTGFNKFNNKHVEPGLTIDSELQISHNWFENGTYTHICLPENWLI